MDSGIEFILAVLGIGGYLAGESRQPVGKELNNSKLRLAIDLGAILFCAGLAGLAGPGWEKLLWGLLGTGFLADAIWDRIEQSRNRDRTPSK